MEHLFAQQELDALFEQQAQTQYTRDLLFSEVVDLMSLVVRSSTVGESGLSAQSKRITGQSDGGL